MSANFTAYLRVYEPLAAFDSQRQTYWRRYAREGRPVGTQEGAARQRMLVMSALGPRWARLPDFPDDAYVLEGDDTLLICPWNLRVRVAQAALSARDGVPAMLADAFIPPALADLARGVVDEATNARESSASSAPRTHEQVHAWGVPLRWFVLVDPADRQVSVQDGERVLRYRTEIANARRRVHRAHSVVKRTLGESAITRAVEGSARWLEEFHPRSLVELDYGGLVSLFSDDALTGDDSPVLVSAALEALAASDREAATSIYEQLVERWRGIRLQERRN